MSLVPLLALQVSFIPLHFAVFPGGTIYFFSLPQVLYCGVIWFQSITLACSDGSENGNPLSTYLTNVPQLSAGETDSRQGATFQLLVLCQDC